MKKMQTRISQSSLNFYIVLQLNCLLDPCRIIGQTSYWSVRRPKRPLFSQSYQCAINSCIHHDITIQLIVDTKLSNPDDWWMIDIYTCGFPVRMETIFDDAFPIQCRV